MHRDPEISLIVSCYNQQPWMEVLISSAIAQRIDVPYEILVCDDGSADGGFDELRRLTASCNLEVHYIWQRDRGFRLSRSRNNGLRCARGRIAVFVDGDCWLAPTFLSDHWRAQSACPSLVCGLRQTVTIAVADLPSIRASALELLPRPVQIEHETQRKWLRSDSPWMACLGGNFSFPCSRDVYFDEQFESWGSEDRDLALRLIRSGLRPHLLEEPNVVQLRLPGQAWADMKHDDVVAFIRNKLLLHTKYPGGELASSVALVRHCHLDPRTQRWSIGGFRLDTSVEEVFRDFETWLATSSGGIAPPRGDPVKEGS